MFSGQFDVNRHLCCIRLSAFPPPHHLTFRSHHLLPPPPHLSIISPPGPIISFHLLLTSPTPHLPVPSSPSTSSSPGPLISFHLLLTTPTHHLRSFSISDSAGKWQSFVMHSIFDDQLKKKDLAVSMTKVCGGSFHVHQSVTPVHALCVVTGLQ